MLHYIEHASSHSVAVIMLTCAYSSYCADGYTIALTAHQHSCSIDSFVPSDPIEYPSEYLTFDFSQLVPA
jgi:hypothetical protein